MFPALIVIFLSIILGFAIDRFIILTYSGYLLKLTNEKLEGCVWVIKSNQVFKANSQEYIQTKERIKNKNKLRRRIESARFSLISLRQFLLWDEDKDQFWDFLELLEDKEHMYNPENSEIVDKLLETIKLFCQRVKNGNQH